jgi:OOP family OmpA-OmpF porin
VVQANDSGFYAGAEDLARAEMKVRGSSLRDAGLPAAESKDNRSETGWRIFAGYRFNPYLALEGGYAVVGDFSFDSPAPGGTVHVDSKKVKAWNLDAVATWPLPYRLSLYARGGIVRSKTDVSVTATGTAVVPRASLSAKDWGYHVGIGAGWDPTQLVGVRIGWERYRVADGIGGEGDVNLLSWGLRVSF